MIIRYFSDLHLEFIKPKNINKFIEQINPGLDKVCVLAGDIGNPYQKNYDTFMNFINSNFKKTFVIAGNHEYYNSTKTVDETKLHLKQYFEKFNNISFLDNEIEHYEGYTFVGTTLWSNITRPKYKINDVYSIQNFNYLKYNSLNKECVSFLENTLNTHTNCIVVTHHMPSYSLIHPKYKTTEDDKYNQWFYCDLEYLMTTNVRCWIYGHTHMAGESTINGVRLLCNPIGYPDENDDISFDPMILL